MAFFIDENGSPGIPDLTQQVESMHELARRIWHHARKTLNEHPDLMGWKAEVLAIMDLSNRLMRGED